MKQKTTLKNGLKNNTNIDDRTPCGLIGEKKNITEIRVNLKVNRKQNSDNIVFTLNSIPDNNNNNNNNNNNSNGICSGTILGKNCKYLKNPLEITFETSKLVSVYTMIENKKLNVPYAYYGAKCPRLSSDFEASVLNPGKISSAKTVDLSVIELSKNIDKSAFGDCKILDNIGYIETLGNTNVCPTLSLDEKLEACYYPEKISYLNEEEIDILYCQQIEDNTNNIDDEIINTFTIREVLPSCNVFDLLSSPRGLMNAKIFIKSLSNNTLNEIISEIELSTLQNGDLQIDKDRLILGQVLNLELGTSIIGEPLDGKIITCNTCEINTDDVDNNNDNTINFSNECKPGFLSDIPKDLLSSGDEDDFIAKTINPWQFYLETRLNSKSNSNVYCNKNEFLNPSSDQIYCTLPTEKCRKLLKNNDNENGFWMYYNEIQSNTMFGEGFNKLGMTSKIVLDRDYGKLFCLTNLTGDGIPGYEQGNLLNEIKVPTPCEIQLNWANLLSNLDISPNLKNFDLGMPYDFNYLIPQYWVDNNYLYRDAYNGGSDEVELDVLIYINGDIIGEVIEISPGKIISTNLKCTVPQGSPNGELIVYIQNTGEITGNYKVTADFINPGDEINSLDVSNVFPQLISLGPGETGFVIFNDWIYNGPFIQDLSVNINLFIDDIEFFSNTNDILLESLTNVGCGISQFTVKYGIFNQVLNKDVILGALRLQGYDKNEKNKKNNCFILLSIIIFIFIIVIQLKISSLIKKKNLSSIIKESEFNNKKELLSSIKHYNTEFTLLNI